jgi:hypothetical protein
LPLPMQACIFAVVPVITRIAIALLLTTLAGGLMAPALCAGGADRSMSCCDPSRPCGPMLGRQSCCVDSPSDPGRSSTGAAGTPVRLTIAAVSVLPALPVDDPTPGASARSETQVRSADPPPLFLLHAAFIC